jgi:hypothetical protein
MVSNSVANLRPELWRRRPESVSPQVRGVRLEFSNVGRVGGMVSQRGVDELIRVVLLAAQQLGVEVPQDGEAVPGPAGHFPRVDPGLDPQGYAHMLRRVGDSPALHADTAQVPTCANGAHRLGRERALSAVRARRGAVPARRCRGERHGRRAGAGGCRTPG